MGTIEVLFCHAASQWSESPDSKHANTIHLKLKGTTPLSPREQKGIQLPPHMRRPHFAAKKTTIREKHPAQFSGWNQHLSRQSPCIQRLCRLTSKTRLLVMLMHLLLQRTRNNCAKQVLEMAMATTATRANTSACHPHHGGYHFLLLLADSLFSLTRFHFTPSNLRAPKDERLVIPQ